MTPEQNPYRPATGESEPIAEQIRRRSTWAAALGIVGLTCIALASPVAVYLAHKCLRQIRRLNVGLEHRGAARVGAVLGWVGTAYSVVVTVMDLQRFSQ